MIESRVTLSRSWNYTDFLGLLRRNVIDSMEFIFSSASGCELVTPNDQQPRSTKFTDEPMVSLRSDFGHRV